jgi:AraC-like DNA-binding protein
MEMMLLAHRPGLSLVPYVEALWYYDGYQSAQHQERVLPDGRFQLIIDLARGPGIVNGMRSKCLVIDTAPIGTVMGVVFQPGGARPFFDAAADEFSNQVVTLDLVWGPSLACLLDRLHHGSGPAGKFRVLETALQQRLKNRLELHSGVQYGLEEFQRAPHVRGVLEVTKEAGLSRRRFSQLFREQVGLTPKLYCRLRRFQEVVRQAELGAPVDWADVALAGGYSDQAHLSHEFRDFSGLSPGEYLAAAKPFANHVRVD